MSPSTTFKIGGELEVNRVGFGAMRITGEPVYGDWQTPQHSVEVIKRAVALDANFIDTADLYGPFKSEEYVGEALYPYDKNIVVGTKGGLVRFGDWTKVLNDATPQHLHDALAGSLRRLKLDRIDLYQLHRIDPRVPVDVTFAFLRQAQVEGKVKHLGLSEVSVDEIKQAQQHFEVASVQNKYAVDNRKWESVLEYCAAQNIAFIPWFPIGGGEIAGEDVLQNVARERGVSSRQVALSWLLHHADNILLIPGTSSLDHVAENMAVADIELSNEEIEKLDAIAPAS
jgi:pyridoxine 4-dehydrogenase